MRVWHYTVGMWLRSILKDQTIKLATTNVPAGERTVVWATTNTQWEPTANKGMDDDGQIVSLGKIGTASYGEGLYRIELMPGTVPYGWDEYKRLGNIPERTAKALARVAREQGSSYRDWRVSFEPVPADKWLRIEVEIRNQWAELSIDIAIAWTRPMFEKGCLVCSETDVRKHDTWRYAPLPNTGEPRALCPPCYTMIQAEASRKKE